MWNEDFGIFTDVGSSLAGAWAASPWMVTIVANVATETPRHMKSEGLSGTASVL